MIVQAQTMIPGSAQDRQLSTEDEKQGMKAIWGKGLCVTEDHKKFFIMMIERMDERGDCKRDQLEDLRYEAPHKALR